MSVFHRGKIPDSFGVGDKTKLILMEEIARLKEIEVSIHKKVSH